MEFKVNSVGEDGLVALSANGSKVRLKGVSLSNLDGLQVGDVFEIHLAQPHRNPVTGAKVAARPVPAAVEGAKVVSAADALAQARPRGAV